ncbi:MAG TPA: hypothetical protein EYG34_09075 [Acidimicrobiia bacterium]|nr:hypothetical protein [Acidimicrobiia bacterium]
MVEKVAVPRKHNVPKSVFVSALLIMLGGVGFMVIVLFGSSPGKPNLFLGAVSFGVPFVAVGVSALIGFKQNKPMYAVVPALIMWPMVAVTFFGLPLLIPAVILFTKAITEPIDKRTAWGSITGSLMVMASFFYSILHQDPAAWSDGKFQNTSSNIRSFSESMIIFFCALVLIGAAWFDPARSESSPSTV